MKLEQAAPILQEIIRTDKKHRDYDHVCKQSTLYKQLITGKDADKLIKPFVRREDPELFKQRVDLTQLLTVPSAEAVMNPFYRVARLDNTKKSIRLQGDQAASDKKLQVINEKLEKYYGFESVDKYLSKRFVQLSFTDPNAFLVTEFAKFNEIEETASPYPFEVSCEQAVMFNYKNNVLEYLVAKIGSRHYMYLTDDILVYTELKDTDTVKAGSVVWVNDQNNKRYLVETYSPKAGEVQAFRIGYKEDLETEGRTYVNPFSAALPYFMKSIKAVSEMDLTMALHAFPQKSQFAEKCEGTAESFCSEGKDENGFTCKACKGTGSKVITTAQDMLLVPKPDLSETNGNYIKLSDMIDYKAPPVDLLKFQDDYVDKLEAKVISAVFNSDILTKATISQTATERIEKKDEMYNTLQPFAEHYSSIWKHVVRLVSRFTVSETPVVIHEFPKDFKLKTVGELLIELKAAEESGAPAFVRQEISKDIAAKIFADDENAFLKFLVKMKFTPFLGKTPDEVKFILVSGYARQEDQILWSHSDTIFDELEQEVNGFFLMSYDLQNKYVTKKIDQIAKGLPNGDTAINFRDAIPKEGEGDPIDLELEAAAKLKGSVGGVDGIISIQQSVSAGTTQYESGLKILQLIYKLSEEDAIGLLGKPEKLEEAAVA